MGQPWKETQCQHLGETIGHEEPGKGQKQDGPGSHWGHTMWEAEDTPTLTAFIHRQGFYCNIAFYMILCILYYKSVFLPFFQNEHIHSVNTHIQLLICTKN